MVPEDSGKRKVKNSQGVSSIQVSKTKCTMLIRKMNRKKQEMTEPRRPSRSLPRAGAHGAATVGPRGSEPLFQREHPLAGLSGATPHPWRMDRAHPFPEQIKAMSATTESPDQLFRSQDATHRTGCDSLSRRVTSVPLADLSHPPCAPSSFRNPPCPLSGNRGWRFC